MDQKKLIFVQEKHEHPTTEDMFRQTTEWLKEQSEEYRECIKCLDYAMPHENRFLEEHDGFIDIVVKVVPGGSEGVYIDWFWYVGDGTRLNIGTLKTLEEGIDAYRMMGTIAGLLTYASWRYVNVNYDAIMKTKKEV